MHYRHVLKFKISFNTAKLIIFFNEQAGCVALDRDNV